jgi:EpsI family protein
MTRWVATVALLGATAWYVVAHPPLNLAVGRGSLAACPVVFGDWNGTELSFDDAVIDELKPDDVLVRRYERGSELVWLCIVYHQHRRYGAHDPRVCYDAQGFLLDPERRVRIADGTTQGLEVNRFTVERAHERRVVYYWWTTNGLTTPDVGAFRQRMALSGALDNRSWGAFVRVEALVERSDAAADSAASDFASRVAGALPQVFAQAERRGVATR